MIDAHQTRARWPAALLGAFLILGSAPSPAQAASTAKKQLSDEQLDSAKKLFKSAFLAYRRGDYSTAISKWTECYTISKRPLIFLSLANANERAGNLDEALDHLKNWREHAEQDEHQELDERILSLQNRLDAAGEKIQVQADEARLHEKETKEGITSYALLAGGGLGVIAGVVLDVIAATSRPDTNAVCTTSGGKLYCLAQHQSAIEESNQLAIAGDISWIVGATLAASGGAIILYQALTADDSDPVDSGGAQALSVDVTVLPSQAFVGARLTF